MLLELEDGKIKGYLTLDEYSKKYNISVSALRSRIFDNKLTPIAIKIGGKRNFYLLKDPEVKDVVRDWNFDLLKGGKYATIASGGVGSVADLAECVMDTATITEPDDVIKITINEVL